LKPVGLILSFILVQVSLQAQYFFTGEVKDPHGDKVQNGYILVRSTGASYRTGFYGEFGITSRKQEDTLTLSFDGYEPYTTGISATAFLQVRLKRLSFQTGLKKNYLKSALQSFTAPAPCSENSGSGAENSGLAAENGGPGTESTGPGTENIGPGTENIGPGSGNIGLGSGKNGSEAGNGLTNTLVENVFVDQSRSVSFRGTTNQASYHIVRRFLDMGYMVPPEAVQIDEILNYFSFQDEASDKVGEADRRKMFNCSSNLLSCPWNKSHKLLCLSICARKLNIENAPPGNLVFLIDASGSMDLPNKLPLVKSGIRLLIRNLRNIDTVSIIEFGGKVRTLIQGIPGSEKKRIIKTMEELVPDGPTPGEEGIKLAYEVARRQFIPGGKNRIILITDGDISEDPSSEKKLEDFIGQQSQNGIYLTCMGVGMSNYKSSQLSTFAQKGQGNIGYIENEQDAEQLLVSQLEPSLAVVADGVFITAGFNPASVKEYRLLGFDNKRTFLEDTTSRLEGSKIGSGHSLLALFELIPKENAKETDTIAEIKINYSLPGENSGQTISYQCPNNLIPFDKAGIGLKKAACVAMFGMKLRESGHVSQISWMDIEKMAKNAFTGNDFIDKEYMALVGKAKRIYMRGKQENE
jgi:Ca-activated chloride channel homolog